LTDLVKKQTHSIEDLAGNVDDLKKELQEVKDEVAEIKSNMQYIADQGAENSPSSYYGPVPKEV